MNDHQSEPPTARPTRSGAYPYLVCGAIALGLVGFAAVQSRADLGRAERTLQTVRGQAVVVDRAEEVADDMRRRIDELHADLSDYDQLDAGSMVAVLTAVVEALPEDVVLDGIRLTLVPEGVRAETAGTARTATALDALYVSLDRAFTAPRIAAGGGRPDAAARGGAAAGASFRASFTIDMVSMARAEAAP